MGPHYLERLFSPRSIAVVGASDREGSLGQVVFRNLLRDGFSGELYAVNPSHETVQGHRSYATISAIDNPVDLAVIATPAATVADIIADAGEHGVRDAVVLSAGFREIGDEGQRREQALLDIARPYGLRIVGPNCVGILRPSIGLNATFSKQSARTGSLALVSQSGAVCTAILDWAPARNIGFSSVVSLGNSADVGFGDVLDYLALDKETHSILLYVEGIQDARRFMSGLRAAARLKPVIVVKSGRHAAGARAAASHSGALVGSDDAFDAALRRAGALRVLELDELFSAAEVLAGPHEVRGNRLGIVTNAGGPGVLATDRATDLRIEVPQPTSDTLQKLNEHLPEQWSHANPVDIIGDAGPERYGEAVRAMVADRSYDGLLVLLTPQAMTEPVTTAEEVVRASAQARIPVMTCWMGDEQVRPAWGVFADAGLPHFPTPEAAVEAFATLANYHLNRELNLQAPAPMEARDEPDVEGARLIIESALASQRTILTTMESKAILRAFHIPTIPAAEANDPNEALILAQSAGYPVVMKISSPDITHKSDVGGVELNVKSGRDVRRIYNEMLARVKAVKPDARVNGITVERMYQSAHGRELIVGVSHDDAFGPVITFGAGGTAVEVLRDRAVTLPPLNRYIATRVIKRTRVAQLLGEHRGMPAVDIPAIEDVLLRVSEIVCELPEVRELDINPLIADEHGAVAVDARFVVGYPPATSRPYGHMAIHPYPAHLEEEWQLPDGTSVTIRPIRPEDARLEEEMMSRLSPQSRYLRFHQSLQELTPQMLIRFTQIDYDREMALIATTRQQGRESQIGVVRYVIDPSGEHAEFAIVVADEFHGRGLGGRLITDLMDIARRRGLRSLYGEVLSDNGPMLSLLRSLGFSMRHRPDEYEVVIATRML